MHTTNPTCQPRETLSFIAMNSSAPLPRTVITVGLVSLLNDFASEMVTPLIPLLLVTSLGAGPMALGLIEGVADAVSNLIKLWAGRRSDLYGQRRKPYIVFGYLLSNVARPLMAIAGAWPIVLAVRVVDRIGKGIRTAPRDALVADVVTPQIAGRAYGFIRALDHGGAVLGTLIAATIVYFATERLDIVIALSVIPGVATVALTIFGLRDATRTKTIAPLKPSLRWHALSPPTRTYLIVLAVFALGKIPEGFLLLRGHELGMSVVELLLLWAAMHAMKVAVSEYAGRIADRAGRRPVILTGWSLYSLVLCLLAFAHAPIHVWFLSCALGLYFGMTEGAERALVRDLSTRDEHGTAFGWFHMIAGLTAIPAGLILGGLWTLVGVKVAFLISSALAAVAVFGFWRWVRPTQ